MDMEEDYFLLPDRDIKLILSEQLIRTKTFSFSEVCHFNPILS